MSSALLFFFFSSRRRHTRLTCDWSSDVCSSDPEREAARSASLCRSPARCHMPSTASAASQIGRASGRERGEISGGGGSLKKKKREKRVRLDGQKRRQGESESGRVWRKRECV